MADDIYGELEEQILPLTPKGELKQIYFDFFRDFKEYFTEFVKESSIDLAIAAVDVTTTPQKLFDGQFGGMSVVVKNQGQVACFISTDRQGAFRLDPDEKERFWLNTEATVVTQSGVTTLGYIRT